jgi:hypothetical protein
MIEAIIAAGLAGAVTVLARGIHHNTSVNHYTESEIKDRIRRMADNRLREYKEQGKISEHEYILLLNRYDESMVNNNNQSTVSNSLSANNGIVITYDQHNGSYSNPNPNSNYYLDLGSNTSAYTLITTMNKILSRLDDIYSKLEERSLNNNSKEQGRKMLNLGEYNNIKVHQNKSITKTKKDYRYNNSKNKKREEEEEYKEGDQRDKGLDPLPMNTINDDNDNNSNNNNYEFNEIEELKKQIVDMISKLEKE